MRKASTTNTSLTRKANAAMRDAVAKVVQDHRQRHMPLAIWQDGRVVRVQPESASLVRERPAAYKIRRRRTRSGAISERAAAPQNCTPAR